jgi:integrase
MAYRLKEGQGIEELLTASHQQLRTWRSSLQLDRNTIIHEVNTVRAFYRWANRSALIPEDPAWNLPIPRIRKGMPRPIDPSTLLMAIECAEGFIRLALVLAGYSGLRCSDMASLRREEIMDTAPNPYMRIYGKGSKWRVVNLSPFVWDELLAFGLPSRGPIFRIRNGRAMTAHDLGNRVNKWLHEVMGIPETIHQGRHHFGTVGQAASGDIVVLASLMGHDDPATTMLYAAPSDEAARALVEAIQPNPWPARRKLDA